MMADSPSTAAVRRAAEIYRPLNVTFELAQGCNLRCSHCYNFDRKVATRPKSDHPPLKPDEVLRTLSQIREAGGLVVAFSGGEAMLHPHLNEFIREARRLHLAVRLKTNGTLLNDKTSKELALSGATHVEVSVYGASDQVHDAFTRIDGSFSKTIKGVRAAQAAGLEVTINFILHRGCVSEFSQMLALAQELGVESAVSMELTGRYDGTMDSLDHRLTADDLRSLYEGPDKDYFAGMFNETDSVQCACARTNAGIGYDGTVYPCIGAPLAAGNLHLASFTEIWRESSVFAWIRSLGLKDFESCAPCEVRPFCQRSSGAIHTNTGNYTGKEDWTCQQATLLRDLNQKNLT